MQGFNNVHRILLDPVGDDHMAGIDPVQGDMDNGPAVVAGMPGRADRIHQFVVADGDRLPVDPGRQSLARIFADLSDFAVVMLGGIGIAEGGGNRMGRVAFHMGRQVQKFLFIKDIRMDSRHFEDPLRQRAGLVEDNGSELRERVHERGAFDKDALPRGRADAPEEGERDGNHQRAGAGNHQEHQGAVKPGRPISRQERRDDSKQDRKPHDNRGIYPREPRDKAFAAGLVARRMLNQFQHLRGRRFAGGLFRPDAQHAAEVDAAGKHAVAGRHFAGNALPRQRDGIEAGCPFQDHAVHRDALPGFDQNHFTHSDFFRAYRHDFPAPLDMGGIRTDVHQVGDGFPGPAFGNAFEEFADLEEQHDEHRLRELCPGAGQETDGERPDRGDGHEEILVQGLPVQQGFRGLMQRLPADDQVRNQV